MRITITLSDEIHGDLADRAASEGRAVASMATRLIEQALDTEPRATVTQPAKAVKRAEPSTTTDPIPVKVRPTIPDQTDPWNHPFKAAGAGSTAYAVCGWRRSKHQGGLNP